MYYNSFAARRKPTIQYQNANAGVGHSGGQNASTLTAYQPTQTAYASPQPSILQGLIGSLGGGGVGTQVYNPQPQQPFAGFSSGAVPFDHYAPPEFHTGAPAVSMPGWDPNWMQQRQQQYGSGSPWRLFASGNV